MNLKFTLIHTMLMPFLDLMLFFQQVRHTNLQVKILENISIHVFHQNVAFILVQHNKQHSYSGIFIELFPLIFMKGHFCKSVVCLFFLYGDLAEFIVYTVFINQSQQKVHQMMRVCQAFQVTAKKTKQQMMTKRKKSGWHGNHQVAQFHWETGSNTQQ